MLVYYMDAVALLGASFYYIQTYKIIKTKSSCSISLPGYYISLFTSINWLVFGTHSSNLPLTVSGILCTIGCILVIVFALKYSKQEVLKHK